MSLCFSPDSRFYLHLSFILFVCFQTYSWFHGFTVLQWGFFFFLAMSRYSYPAFPVYRGFLAGVILRPRANCHSSSDLVSVRAETQMLWRKHQYSKRKGDVQIFYKTSRYPFCLGSSANWNFVINIGCSAFSTLRYVHIRCILCILPVKRDRKRITRIII